MLACLVRYVIQTKGLTRNDNRVGCVWIMGASFPSLGQGKPVQGRSGAGGVWDELEVFSIPNELVLTLMR